MFRGVSISGGSWWARTVEVLILFLARTFPKRFRTIPRLDGQPLLRQFLVCRIGPKDRPWIEIFLQSFVNGETMEWMHRHRWARMVSFVLCGRFCEERYPGRLFWVHAAPSVYMMDQTTIHRLDWAAEKTWTLFVGLANNGQWDYWRRPTPEAVQRTPWQEMIPPEKRVKAL